MNGKRERPLSLHVAGSTILISCALCWTIQKDTVHYHFTCMHHLELHKTKSDAKRRWPMPNARRPSMLFDGDTTPADENEKQKKMIFERFVNSTNVLSSSVGSDTNEVGDTFSIKWLFFLASYLFWSIWMRRYHREMTPLYSGARSEMNLPSFSVLINSHAVEKLDISEWNDGRFAYLSSRTVPIYRSWES